MILNKFNTINSFRKLISLASNERERTFIKDICKKCGEDIIIYYLSQGQIIYGFVAVSVNKINNIPCISIEYLLVKEEYRKKIYEELDKKFISEFLIYFVYELGKKLKNDIGIRWLALIPDNAQLEKYYINTYNFVKYETNKKVFLFLSLKY